MIRICDQQSRQTTKPFALGATALFVALLIWGTVHPHMLDAGQAEYKGRKIAQVMSAEGADWLTREDRQKFEQPEKVLDALDIRPGMTVADIGAGNGYFTLRLARRVKDTGKVLAVD